MPHTRNLKLGLTLRTACIAVVLVLSAYLALTFNAPAKVSATDSKVGASLFSTTDPPTVTVDTPPPTSTTNNPQLTISGTTVNTTEIKVYLNGVLVATLDTTWGTFSTTITLPEQTSTILLSAYSSYSDQTTEITRIVTYLPAVTPGDGEGPGGGSSGGGSSGNPGVPDTGFLRQRTQRLLVIDKTTGYAIPLFYWLVVLASIILFLAAVLPTPSNPLLRALIPRARKKSDTPEEFLRGSFLVCAILCLVVFLL